ncbi:MAG TPA: exosortase A [Sphingomonas sp.]|nr:exosortase A [Sphingomonas sp.]
MTIALRPASVVRPASPWVRHCTALALAAATILLLYRTDAAKLASLLWTSTNFGHCLFIPPVVGWLVWIRRAELKRMTPAAWWPGAALLATGGAAWLVGDAATVTFARQFGLVVMLQGAVVTLLGPHVGRALLFPLAYALFVVPFGEWIEPWLQAATVAQVMPLLRLAGVPATVDGVLIHAGRYYFEVAEACSGAKFVLAMIAFAALVAHVCFVSNRRRAAFLAAAIVVPILANGVRAFATIYAAHLTSVEAATGLDHIVYGWLFFGLVMATLLALGWRWFDRAPDAPAFDPVTLPAPLRHRIAPAAAFLLVAAVAAAFPAWSGATALRRHDVPPRIDLPAVPGWTRAPLSTRAPWQPWYPGADHYLFGRYRDTHGTAVDVAIALFGHQREGAKLGAFGTGVLREEDRWVRVEDLPPIAGGAAVRLVAAGPVERVVVSWYGVGGVITADPRRVKLETLRTRLFGGSERAVAIHLSAEVVPGSDPRLAIRRLSAALGPLDTLADRARSAAEGVDPAIEQIRP